MVCTAHEKGQKSVSAPPVLKCNSGPLFLDDHIVNLQMDLFIQGNKYQCTGNLLVMVDHSIYEGCSRSLRISAINWTNLGKPKTKCITHRWSLHKVSSALFFFKRSIKSNGKYVTLDLIGQLCLNTDAPFQDSF